MIKKAIMFIVFFILLTNYISAGESFSNKNGLSFSTTLNKPDSRNSLAEYRAGEELAWGLKLENRDLFNANVCFFLETQNTVYDITQFIIDKANEQYCPGQNCVRLNSIDIGAISPAMELNILRYPFPSSFTEGNYQLIAQIRKSNNQCSENVIDSELIAKSTNFFKFTNPQTCPPAGSGNPPFAGCRTSNPSNSDSRTGYTCSQNQQCYQCWAGYFWDGNNCVRKYYFVFVPIPPEWGTDQQFFEQKARDRAVFFKDISKFRDRLVEFVYVPIDYVNSNCDLSGFRLNTDLFSNHQKIKDCADRYTRSLGISYERAVGFSNTFNGGLTFFTSRMVWASRGNDGRSDWPSVVAHEFGHTYNLCEEYSYSEYARINTNFGGNFCKNRYPSQCSQSSTQCPGNIPTFRDYSGNPPIQGVCEGSIHYSVMGWPSTMLCGYDNTGGYEAVG